MKLSNLVLVLLFVIGFSIHAQAQGTASATMRVSATIVSGATLTNSQQININLSNDLMTGGTIQLNTSQNFDTEISFNDKLVLTNENGETIKYYSESVMMLQNGRKVYEVLTSPVEQEHRNLEGTYTGELIASVQYL